MKMNYLFLLLFTLSSVTLFGQVQKQNVVIEKFTGIYCGACPSAVHNIHDLIENENANIIVVSHHSASTYSDPLFENPDSDGRNSYYSSMITGFPTVIFDGVETPDFSTGYPAYVDCYNSRISELSPVDINLDFTWNGDDSYTANVTITKEGGISSTDLRLQLALTETNINFAWMGEEKLYDVTRKMMPDYNGTTLDFSSVDELTFNIDFTVDSDWNPDYCKVIAFVQDNDTKETFQGVEVSIANTSEENDATPYMILGIDDDFCGNVLAPQVWIRNSSGSHLTSVDINSSINGGDIETFHWTGDLAPFEEELVALSEMIFSSHEFDNHLVITTSNPNGSIDEDPSNDEISHDFDASQIIGTTPSIEFRTDEWPFLNSWELTDADGNIVAESGYLESYTVYNESFNLEDGCYNFTIYDETGNGFVNWAGEDGYFIFYDADGIEMVNVIDFGYELTILFQASSTISVEENISKDFLTTFPNPAKNSITIENSLLINEYQIINNLGQVVTSRNGINSNNITVDLTSFKAGLYIIRISDNEGLKSRKIEIRK